MVDGDETSGPTRSIDDLLTPKPVVRPRLYAYSIADAAHAGLLKVGQTTRAVKRRVEEQTKTAGITPFIELDVSAERDDGSVITDHAVREALRRKGFANPQLEWMRCTVADVASAIEDLRSGKPSAGTRDQTFGMRREQAAAVAKTFDYFRSIEKSDPAMVPRFLWNAKMRFGKTFTTYQLAKRLGAKRVLVVTFKPAVEDAWRSDLERHRDFEGWRYFSVASSVTPALSRGPASYSSDKGSGTPGRTRGDEGCDPRSLPRNVPLVYFGSFQDLLGRDTATGAIKPKNEWIHTTNWDLVVFDEYHFGAWRESARELFEGEEEAIGRTEALLADDKKLAEKVADLHEPLEPEATFLPITTKAYLYLSGTPFRALNSGEFIEEQIFDWTYTDEQRAKAEWDAVGSADSGTPVIPASSRDPASSGSSAEEGSGTPGKARGDGGDAQDRTAPSDGVSPPHPAAARLSLSPAGRGKNPYASLPQMRLLTYRMPEELLTVASGGEFDEFDLNEFFKATGAGVDAAFTHKDDVQKWLSIIRGEDVARSIESLRTPGRIPWPYGSAALLSYLQHSFWFLPDVAACHAMANLLREKHNVFWHDYTVVVAAGTSAGMGLAALEPVRRAIGSGTDTKTITLSCGKLTTGVTVPQWSSILMLRNLKSPETYFQAAFRVQSPWTIRNPDGDDPNAEEIRKPECLVFDFAPTRALRQLSDYAIGLSPREPNPENAVKELISFLPVLAYNGAVMQQIDAGDVLDIALAGTSATLLARKWQSALLVNVDNATLARVLASPEAMDAVARIVGWRNLGESTLETIIAKSEKIKELKAKAKDGGLSETQKKELTAEEKAFKSKRKEVQEKLIKFATRIPAFMYLTDYREHTLKDVITRIEPDLFLTVTGLTVADFDLLVRLQVFNTEQMNAAVFAFRRYEDASLRYTGIDSHDGLTETGGWDTVTVLG